MGLFERLLQEREVEEPRTSRPFGHLYGAYSATLGRLLANAPEDRSKKKYGADLSKLHQYIHKGVHSPGAGMHYRSLKATHLKEYAELKAEAQRQGELLHYRYDLLASRDPDRCFSQVPLTFSTTSTDNADQTDHRPSRATFQLR
jgi:hypothetical protein